MRKDIFCKNVPGDIGMAPGFLNLRRIQDESEK